MGLCVDTLMRVCADKVDGLQCSKSKIKNLKSKIKKSVIGCQFIVKKIEFRKQ